MDEAVYSYSFLGFTIVVFLLADYETLPTHFVTSYSQFFESNLKINIEHWNIYAQSSVLIDIY